MCITLALRSAVVQNCMSFEHTSILPITNENKTKRVTNYKDERIARKLPPYTISVKHKEGTALERSAITWNGVKLSRYYTHVRVKLAPDSVLVHNKPVAMFHTFAAFEIYSFWFG